MKILFIITQSEIGGAQRYLLEFTRYLISHGHEVTIVAGEGDDELFQQSAPKLPGSDPGSLGAAPCQIKISNLIRNLNPLKDFLALLSILSILRKEKPNVLFLQSTKAGFLGSLAASILNLKPNAQNPKIIYRIGGWSFNDPRSPLANKILLWMEKISARWKDVIIVNSELDRQIAISQKIIPENKIVKIYNGIDPNSINFLPEEEAASKLSGSNPDSFEHIVIGTVANLYATKGIEYLIESANILTKTRNLKPVTFVVIGEGRERPKLEALVKKYNLENNFLLVGRISNARQYLKVFDIFVLPSVKEGFPWALLEAMSAEIPIIATDVGAISEIIGSKKEGILIPPKDAKTLADAIKYLVENPDQGRRLAKNAKEKLKKFNIEKMLSESEAILLPAHRE